MENLGNSLDSLTNTLLNYHLTYVDLLIIFFLIWSIFMGWKKGFIVQAISLSALISGIWISTKLTKFVFVFFKKQNEASVTLEVISFGITFFFVIAGTLMLAKIVQAMVADVKLTKINRLFGIILSLFKYAFYISIISIFLNRLDVLPERQKENAFLFEQFQYFAPAFYPYLEFK